ncbi:MAG TPA: hypothetical protein VHE81_11455 [Lacipirellulaceae bacterium]|nr:hypothetical protein [Lacipirellulaceae bacterium]
MPRTLNEQTLEYGLGRSALALTVGVVAVAAALLPIAGQGTGSAGMLGLAAAAGICLVSGIAAECIAALLTRCTYPLAGQLSGMIVRLFLPLAACLVLALQGFRGRENLAFVGYLLAFYIATLAFQTWLAIKRVAGPRNSLRPSAR